MLSLGVGGAALSPRLSYHSPPSHRRIPSRPAANRTAVSFPLGTPRWKLNSGETPNSISKRVSSLAKKTLLFSFTAAGLPALFLPVSNASGVGNGGGNGGGGGEGGGGGGGDGFWSRFFNIPAAAAVPKDENDEERKSHSQEEWDSHGLPANIVVKLNKLSGLKKYKLSEIIFFDSRIQKAASSDEDQRFFENVSATSADHLLRPGGVYTKAQLQKHLQSLARFGTFEKLDMEAKTNPDGTLALKVSFREFAWDCADKFKCISVGLMPPPAEVDRSTMLCEEQYVAALDKEYKKRVERARACVLPPPVHAEVMQMIQGQEKMTGRMLYKINQMVEKWYHDAGYVCARVLNLGSLHTEGGQQAVCEIAEGDISRLDLIYKDELGHVCEGNTQRAIVERNLPQQLRPGHIFNLEAARLALDNMNSLGLFSHIEVNPRDDDQNEGSLVVEIKLKEMEPKSAEVSTEWSIVPGPGGRPTLGSLQPGGTISLEHKNIKGLKRSVNGSVTTSNILNPDQDNLSFQFEYAHPYMDGVDNPRDRTFRTSCFNSRKLSPVFTGGPESNDVPPIWVDRTGVKANITENLTRQSKFTYGVVMEEITTRDENRNITKNGHKVQSDGRVSVGPPTTLSGLGVDRTAFLQANITRDNTKIVNGAIVGERNIFQMDQGIGIGSKFPLFNRHQLSLTRFIPLKQVEEGPNKSPPPILVLHGHYGGCVGDLPSYDAFTLGGPYSVRGYNMGELGAARYILEFAGELRIPVKKAYAYAFAEHGNDLGSSKDVKGNPTETYRRMGQGSSYGVGAKFGQVRAEYAIDHNSGTGALFFRYGERF